MKTMFQMINDARLTTGLQGLSIASIAYLHALKHTKERFQGSSLLDLKNPSAPRVPIIQHIDVRRMLLWMKSNVEGMRALMYYTAICSDMASGNSDPPSGKVVGYSGSAYTHCKGLLYRYRIQSNGNSHAVLWGVWLLQ